MNMTSIESKIMEEAKSRAAAKLNGFSILSTLSDFNLDPETTLTIEAPRRKTADFYSTRLSITLSEFEAAFRSSLLKILADQISGELTAAFVAKTASVDVSAL